VSLKRVTSTKLQGIKKLKTKRLIRRGKSVKQSPWSDVVTRTLLTLGLFALVAILSVQAAVQSGAMPVLERVLSVLSMAAAFFFGQKSVPPQGKE
jgi:hypothetical protein